jgi:hypothetical protein
VGEGEGRLKERERVGKGDKKRGRENKVKYALKGKLDKKIKESTGQIVYNKHVSESSVQTRLWLSKEGLNGLFFLFFLVVEGV